MQISFSPTTGYLSLILVCLLLFLPGQTVLPPFDRDEARFAQASRQMLESGDFLDIRFQEQPRHKKPIGIYWLQALSTRLGSEPPWSEIWSYRLPSLLGAIAAVLLTFAVGSRLFDPKTAFLGALLLATTLLLNVEARMATTDAALLACILAVQGVLALAYLNRDLQWRLPLPLWVGGLLALALGILIKGPVILLVAGTTAAVLSIHSRSLGWLAPLRPALSAALLLALTLPWLAMLGWQSEGRFFAEWLGRDILAKLFSGQESHGAPPGLYLLTWWIALWPVSFLVALALPYVWRQRATPAVLFCLAWIVPTWVIFELIPTKLPHYLLPVYPAVTLLAAHAWRNATAAPAPGYRSAVAWIWWIVGAALPLAAAGGFYYLQHGLSVSPGPALTTGVTAAAVVAAWWLRGRQQVFALLTATAILFYWSAFGQALPSAERFWLSRSVAAALQQQSPGDCPRYRLLSVGYREPSLVFLVGTDTLLQPHTDDAPHRVESFLQQERCGMALVPQTLANTISAAAPNLETVAVINGFNYSKGRWLSLALLKRR